MKRLETYVVRGLLVGCAVLAGCGGTSTGSDEDELGHPPPAMVGTWRFQSATENGSSTSLASALEWEPATTGARLHIESNGTYWYEELNGSGAQVWAEGGWIFVDEEGGTIQAHVQWDSDGSAAEVLDLEYMLSGGVLTLEQMKGVSTFVYTLTL